MLSGTSTLYVANPLFFHNDEMLNEKGKTLSRGSPKGPLPSDPSGAQSLNPDKGKQQAIDQYPEPDNSNNHENPSLKGITIIASQDLAAWHHQLQHRVVIVLCHGIRPPLETLKSWMAVQWEYRNNRASHVQYLPNNYYLLFFDDNQAALQVISHGQWIIKNTPMSVFNWFTGLNPKGSKPSKVLVWVDFVDLPIEYYPWLKQIGSCIGRVLGQKESKGINPKWDPQLLVEVDLSKDLHQFVPIKNSERTILHKQKVLYKTLPNACFHCFKQGHHIKECPELKTPAR
ncbi:hypothetical protein L7F22_020468 [Adiantum nelumboides]|nr:hypothetical protein [Adiantum nelumboides]